MLTIDHLVGRTVEYQEYIGAGVDQRLLDMKGGVANRRALATLAPGDPAREIPQASIDAEVVDLFW